ncbi:expressed unknown protein [Seminavis robusta]|uniref:Uncharacterized protein n=1 Tax=Seminavis robusta TaxID=568900 RepID=A0A9N8EII5_9STRA|nr:expressed unknown protein [Seminavis robusta]|eukprot:Sro989_g228500.1 n/a (286) ;mRNA; r:23102-23959
MSGRVEIGSKRSRNCVSPPPTVDDEEDHAKVSSSSSSDTTSSSANAPANLVWKQWTSNFRKTRRLENDLIVEEGIDAAVERHMSLNKKRSLMDDDSDSDDEGNYYKLDVPQRRHPLEFTPSGFLPRLGPQQVTPVSCDPGALPVCSLRRYGHGDEEDEFADRIPPPPPSFHRYPSKKRAVGLARPEPEQDFYSRTMAPPLFTRGVSSLAIEKEGLLKKLAANSTVSSASTASTATTTTAPLFSASLPPPSWPPAPPMLGLASKLQSSLPQGDAKSNNLQENAVAN